ncbi:MULTISPECIES: ASCH domain-containing protein [Butyricimonas]|jgi:hypothetical protein|uniref:ASCH domain-containing protein n=1 Tax=Butyricimonas TaxID=574697 RepID=UPI002065B90F|nr:ASCH domain-containing protein [Butyricimonas paravirosa]DAW84724.1 MAG TPA: ASCH domain protein [Bacteriophage sp.]
MKTITIKQPWASLIVHGIKDIENRTWKCPKKYIGQRILIHAGKSSANFWDYPVARQVDEFIRQISKSGTDWSQYPFGSIVGSVEIVDCVREHPSIWAEKDVWNWILANPIQFREPIPFKGKLSFWNYSGIPEPEFDEDGHRICICTMNIKEENQVIRMADHFECLYCGGYWNK